MNKDTNQIMALIDAYKMDGLGNNFIVIDRRKNSIEITKEKIINLAKNKAFLFDQLITLEKKEDEKVYPIKIYNPDGVEVTACGNGSRCVAYLLSKENKQKNIIIKTKERILNAEIVGEKKVKINMGKAKFNWEEIPLIEKMNTEKIDIDFLNKQYGYGFCLNIGNPHIIFFVKDCSEIEITKLGPKIENYKYFPQRVNVTFAQIVDKKNIKLSVWERGAGQTKACGTAACATVVSAKKKGLVDKNSNVLFKEGNLEINYEEEIFMTGSVSEIKKINLDI